MKEIVEDNKQLNPHEVIDEHLKQTQSKKTRYFIR